MDGLAGTRQMLDGLYEGAPVGLGVWDGDLRYRRVNRRLAEINGLPAEAHIGRRPGELLGEIGCAAEAAMRRVQDTGVAIVEMDFSGELPATPDRQRHWLASFFPLEGANGGPPAIGGVVIEITDRRAAAEREHAALHEAETARARAETLARASIAVTSSIRTERILNALVAEVVPSLADCCAIHLARAGQPPQLYALAHVDPDSEPLVRELGEVQVAGSPTRGPATVIASGQREIYRVLEADPARPEAERLIRELCFSSAAILPLRARGKVLGAITLLMGTSGRQYDEGLVELVESLAALAGLALDNARLFAEQREVATALQRTLLPSQLPDVPGAELAARYRASGRSNQVGGDFYDVLPTGGDEWALVIGDVAGKGAEAAAITALVRATLQAAVLRGDRPRQALGLVDEALRRRSASVQFCSALHGRMRPRRGGGLEIELLSAGHPPPLVLRADGSLEQVQVAGTLLGISNEPAFGEVHFALAPGDVLLLYTDGAIELRGEDPWRGEAVLRETLLASASVPLPELVERVEHEALVLGGGELRDDLALLAVGATVADGQ